MSTGAAQSAGSEGRQIGFNLAVIMLGAIMLALGLAYGIDALSQPQPSQPDLHDSGPAHSVYVGGKRLTVPKGWLRFQHSETEGFASQLDLKILPRIGRGNGPAWVEVRLVPRGQARTSSALLDRVYLHQFSQEELEGPVGLIGKPLVGEEGFQDESVWYDPLSPEPFVAKCMAPIEDGTAGRCLRTVLIGDDLAATYTFDQALMNQWQIFDSAISPWLARIGAY